MKLDLEVKAEALGQIKRRATIQFNWDDEPYVEVRCLRLFRRAVICARRLYRHLEGWDKLLRDETHDAIDSEMLDAINWQDTTTDRMVRDEHNLTLTRCFMAIGVDEKTASKIVEYIIAKEKQQEVSD